VPTTIVDLSGAEDEWQILREGAIPTHAIALALHFGTQLRHLWLTSAGTKFNGFLAIADVDQYCLLSVFEADNRAR
jgi:hypothetical protein